MSFQSRVFAAINLAINNESFPQDLMKALKVVKNNVIVKVSNRMTRCAGSASVRLVAGKIVNNTLTIKLSSLLMCRGSHEEQENIILHELAHLVDYVMRNKSDHSLLWRRIHVALGGTGHQYHTIDRTGLHKTIKRYEYLDTRTGKVQLFTSANHCKIMRFDRDGVYKYLAEVKLKGKEVVSRYEAQYATAANTTR